MNNNMNQTCTNHTKQLLSFNSAHISGVSW